MTTKIPDAPYIVEAETKGVPPYDEVDLCYARSRLIDADYDLGQAVQMLCNAADNAEGTEHEKKIEELIERLEDLRCDISARREKMK